MHIHTILRSGTIHYTLYTYSAEQTKGQKHFIGWIEFVEPKKNIYIRKLIVQQTNEKLLSKPSLPQYLPESALASEVSQTMGAQNNNKIWK